MNLRSTSNIQSVLVINEPQRYSFTSLRYPTSVRHPPSGHARLACCQDFLSNRGLKMRERQVHVRVRSTLPTQRFWLRYLGRYPVNGNLHWVLYQVLLYVIAFSCSRFSTNVPSSLITCILPWFVVLPGPEYEYLRY